ncbi:MULTISPECIES: Lsr2 dimerization domain-containing protein [Clavibacter]|uniref:Transcriptional regulator, histone-like protein n=1 Tax=Clavibacter tessellarius TaxID=31965 RepID=A0A154UZA1_9MICO|nr:MULTISPECIES: histone-like nucleoid-structuring protein Lsr2 [Clavibacter]KZC94349.1 transcriptional regulator, histone-like protein [Clavibacter michiganensis subsp. tessellarius]MDA3804732.1 Lsr2 family protein [Clavibacter sp. CT19]
MADDRDPQRADEGSAPGTEPLEAVRFGLDGWVLEVDLDEADARALRSTLAPYATAGRRTTVTVTPVADPPPVSSGASPAATGERAAARAWLEANGHRIGTRGRISATLMTLYRARDGR